MLGDGTSRRSGAPLQACDAAGVPAVGFAREHGRADRRRRSPPSARGRPWARTPASMVAIWRLGASAARRCASTPGDRDTGRSSQGRRHGGYRTAPDRGRRSISRWSVDPAASRAAKILAFSKERQNGSNCSRESSTVARSVVHLSAPDSCGGVMRVLLPCDERSARSMCRRCDSISIRRECSRIVIVVHG